MFGLQDQISGEFFDTKGVTISYVIKGPVFRGDEKADGSLVFNMELPPTDKNKKLTGFLNRIENFNNQVNELSIYGYLNGQLIWTGTMLAKFVRPEGIEVSIGLGRGEFNYLAEGKVLSEMVPDEEHTVGHIQLETDLASGIPHYLHAVDGFDDVVNKVYPEVNHAVFPVKIDDMVASLGSAFNNVYYNTTPCVNFWDMDAQKFASPALMGNFFLMINSLNVPETNTNILTYLLAYNIFMPFPYNSWVFKNLFRKLGYFLENNPFETDEDLKRLVLFNVQSINKLWEEYAHYAGSGSNPNTDRYLYSLEPNLEFNLKDHLPEVAVKDYLRALEDLLFFRCFIDNKTKRVKVIFLKDIVNSTEYVDITDRVAGIKERKLEYDKISALVQTYDSNDGNGGNLKARSEVEAMERIPDVYTKEGLPVNDLGQYVNKICYAITEKKYYVCAPYSDDFNHTSEWVEYGPDYYMQMYIRSTGKEWTTEMAGIVNSYFTDFRPGTGFLKYEWFIPYCKMGLKFYNSFKTKDNSCGLRLMFYRGLQDGKVQSYHTDEFVHFIDGQAYVNAFRYLTLPEFGYEYSQATANAIVGYIMANHTLVDVTNYFTHYGYPWSVINDFCIIATENVLSGITTKKYPLGTNDVYNAFGNKIPEANLSLRWDGEYGIYEKYAKDFVRFKNENAKSVTIIYQPESGDLFFDFSKKQRINGIDYLFDEIRGEIRADGSLGVAEVDGWSC